VVKKILVFIASALILIGCSNPENKQESAFNFTPVPLKYATGFTIDKADDFYLVKVLTPYKGANKPLNYILYDRHTEVPKVAADAYIPVPVKSIVCTSTTHIPLLDYLGETNSLVGFPTLNYISSEPMRKRIDNGEVEELGIDEALNIEKLVNLNPEMVMGYSMSGDFGQFNLISEAGTPVLLNAEYLESHPLGRAEWIKLAALLFNKIALADSIFKEIDKQYNTTLEMVSKSATSPTVMSGIVYGDSWFVPGGKNYASRILKDAGFNYLWQQDTSSAFLPLSFETVFNQAKQASFWIGVGSFKTLEELTGSDSRYEEFLPFKQHTIFSYDKRRGAKGGSEFLELGYLRPDLILKDLVKIGHPILLPEHELFFHFQLP
jgi:iron complex transport system substrate-binding protein